MSDANAALNRIAEELDMEGEPAHKVSDAAIGRIPQNWKRVDEVDPFKEGLHQVAFRLNGKWHTSIAKWYHDTGWSRNVTDRDGSVYWKELSVPPLNAE